MAAPAATVEERKKVHLKLYWNQRCPYVQRVRIIAAEKRFELDMIHVPMSQEVPEWYLKVNPQGTVPTLQHGERTVYGGRLIAAYLDSRLPPKRSLYPGTTQEQYRTQYFVTQAENYGFCGQALLKEPKSEAARRAMTESVQTIEQLLTAQSEGPFFLGDTFTMADIALVPFVDRYRHVLKAYAWMDVLEKAPRTQQLLAAALRRPSVAATSIPEEACVALHRPKERDMVPPRALKLYAYEPCCFGERIRITAALKGVPLDVTFLDLFTTPEWYKKDVIATGALPTLVTPQGVMTESMLIAEFLDREYPHSGLHLIPADPWDECRMRHCIERAERFARKVGPQLMSQSPDGTAVRILLREVEALLADNSPEGPFFLGTEMCLADVALAPHVVRVFLALVADFSELASVPTDFPRTKKFLDAALAHPQAGSAIIKPAALKPHMVTIRAGKNNVVPCSRPY